MILMTILVLGVFSMAQAQVHMDLEAKSKKYKYNIKVQIRGAPECVAQSTDEVYFRISDSFKNPKNLDNHDRLVVKGEVENIDELAVKKGTPLTITFSGKFDPKSFEKKYKTPLKDLREYIELYKNEVEVHDEYKGHVKFDPKRTSYSWSHGVNFGCDDGGEGTNQLTN